MTSFALPLVQVSREGLATTVWGQVRPGTGARRYLLQRRVGASWRTTGGPGTTTARGYLTRTVRAGPGVQLRLYDPATRRASPVLVIS
jgi:hypothetical protein